MRSVSSLEEQQPAIVLSSKKTCELIKRRVDNLKLDKPSKFYIAHIFDNDLI